MYSAHEAVPSFPHVAEKPAMVAPVNESPAMCFLSSAIRTRAQNILQNTRVMQEMLRPRDADVPHKSQPPIPAVYPAHGAVPSLPRVAVAPTVLLLVTDLARCSEKWFSEGLPRARRISLGSRPFPRCTLRTRRFLVTPSWVAPTILCFGIDLSAIVLCRDGYVFFRRPCAWDANIA